MSNYAYPVDQHFQPAKQTLLVLVNQAVTESILSLDTQTLGRPGSKWGWDIDLSTLDPAEFSDVEGFLVGLSGRQHTTTIHDYFRPVPRGTCNLTGVTLGATVNQFAVTATLNGCGAGRTLLRGDWIKIGTQLVKIIANATANGSGVMNIEFRHSMRATVTSGTGIGLDKPTSTYVLTESNLELVRTDTYGQEGPSFRLVEDFV